jgi:hypothetical protein
MRTRRRFGRLPLMSVLIVLTMVTLGAIGPMAAATPMSETVASARLDPASSLVGTWQRVIRCKELVRALEKAGLEESVLEAVVGTGFLPGVTSPDQIADPRHPCEGAVAQLHAHFFTADGQFGSLDGDGNQVDEGTYTIVDDTLVMPYGFEEGPPILVMFHLRIHRDWVRFYPVIPSDCSTSSRCLEAAVWSVSVAFTGKKWTRVS